MKAKGVIKEAVPWAESRKYFFYLAKRRIAQDNYLTHIQAADPSLTSKDALAWLKEMCTADWENNEAVLDYYTKNDDVITSKISEVKTASITKQIAALQAELGK
jgi:acetyl-CoA carboxylase/biotin carboxylase 1